MTPPPLTAPNNTPTPPAAEFEAEDILASIRARARQKKSAVKPWYAMPQAFNPCTIAPRELPPGMRLGNYTLLRVLGTGGFAVTYLAEENTTGQQVVIKEHFPEYLCHRDAESLHVQVADDAMASACATACSNFLREHSLLSTLNHPHIPRATTCFRALSTAYFATEYIDGQTLHALREACTTHQHVLPQEETYATLVRLLDALHYLHECSLLHRDIKPTNILISREGLPKLIDFGAAQALHSNEPTYVVETPGFSPAEQSQGRGQTGPWSDIYALGATFYYLLTGTPLPPSSQREFVDSATPLTQHHHLRAHYHPRLLASIDRATRPHAAERYQQVSEWLADLRG